MALRQRSRAQNRQTKSKRTSRTTSSRGKPRRKQDDLQQRVFQVFAEQADSLWSRLADQCRQFADGFNKQLGAAELMVETDATTLRAAYPKGDAELFVKLDRTERYVQCWLNTGCATYGSCCTDQPPVGMTVRGNALHFAFGGEIVSDEHLAITLLTRLTSTSAEPEES